MMGWIYLDLDLIFFILILDYLEEIIFMKMDLLYFL